MSRIDEARTYLERWDPDDVELPDWVVDQIERAPAVRAAFDRRFAPWESGGLGARPTTPRRPWPLALAGGLAALAAAAVCALVLSTAAPPETTRGGDGHRAPALVPLLDPAAGGTFNGRQAGQLLDARQIASGSVALTVDAWEPARNGIVAWVEEHGGHVGDESLVRAGGVPSVGSLRLRVPNDQLAPLLTWLQEVEQVDRFEVHRTEVTAEWVDLQARLGALRVTQQRLLELAGHREGELADVLAAEAELARVGGEIESLEGRRRALADQSELATIDVTIGVRAAYVPPLEEPLAAEARRALADSIAGLTRAARALVVGAVGALPWLVVVGGPLGVAALAWTARRRGR